MQRVSELDREDVSASLDLLMREKGIVVLGLSLLEAIEGALHRPLEFVRRSTQRELDCRGLMGYGDGLVAGQSGLQHASDVIPLGLMAVGIAEMRLNSSNSISKSPDRSLDAGLNKRDDLLTSMDMVIRIDLNLHPTPSLA